MKYLVGFFYRNSLTDLRVAVRSLEPYWKHTIIIDNTPDLTLKQEAPFPSGVKIIEPLAPLSFTQSMNYTLQMAEEKGCAAVIFTHNDVEAHPGMAERFLTAVKNIHQSGRKWGIVTAHGFLFAAINVRTIRDVGLWDTFFPSMFSDYDYCQRMHLGGYELIETYYPLTHHNGGSSTLRNDPMLWSLTALNGPIWMDYYKAKWGGEPLHETYRIPFDVNSTVPPPTSWAQAMVTYDG